MKDEEREGNTHDAVIEPQDGSRNPQIGKDR